MARERGQRTMHEGLTDLSTLEEQLDVIRHVIPGAVQIEYYDVTDNPDVPADWKASVRGIHGSRTPVVWENLLYPGRIYIARIVQPPGIPLYARAHGAAAGQTTVVAGSGGVGGAKAMSIRLRYAHLTADGATFVYFAFSSQVGDATKRIAPSYLAPNSVVNENFVDELPVSPLGDALVMVQDAAVNVDAFVLFDVF